MRTYNSMAEIDAEIKMIRDCTRWLCYFLDKAKSRRDVTGEAIKQGFLKTHLKEARKILGVRLMQYEGEDYWYITKW